MGVHWTGIVFGLGFVISFGYWTTDFLVVQRVLAAHNLRAARMAPIIGSFFKMAVPFIVILPGLLGLVLLQNPDGSHRQLVGEDVVKSCAASTTEDKIQDPAGCSTALSTKTSLSAEAQQKVLSAAPNSELHSYNEALPLMMVRYCGPGLLGLGITALIAGFMSCLLYTSALAATTAVMGSEFSPPSDVTLANRSGRPTAKPMRIPAIP